MDSAPRVERASDAVISTGRLLALPIRAYRRWLSPLKPPMCRFAPTCSQYAIEALEVHGVGRGVWLSIRRIARCHPFCEGGHDPVPPLEENVSGRSILQRLGSSIPWLAWVAMSIATMWFVLEHGSRFPFADAVSAVPYIADDGLPPAQWLWRFHNDHRLFVPKALVWASTRVAGGDFRGPLVVQVLLLSLAAAACIVVARRLRGRTSVWDAFFPILWLNWGNAFNLFSGWQLQMTLMSLLVVVAVFALARPQPSPRHVIAAGVACGILPLCGGGGVPQAAVFAVFLAWTGFRARHEDRVVTKLASAFALLSAAVLVAYFTDFGSARVSPRSGNGIVVASKSALGLASYAFGGFPLEHWHFLGAGVLAIGIAGGFVLVRTRPIDAVTWALLAGLAMQAALIAASVIARSDPEYFHRNSRYVSILYPWVTFAYLAWTLAPLRIQPAGILFVATTLMAVWLGLRPSIRYADRIRRGDRDMFERVQSGATSLEIALSVDDHVFGDKVLYARNLVELRLGRRGPFEHVAWSRDVDNEHVQHWEGLPVQPVLVSPSRQVVERKRRDREVIAIRPPGRVDFAVPRGASKISGRVGMIVKKLAVPNAPSLEFTVDAAMVDGTSVRLWSGHVDPSTRIKECELTLDITVPPNARKIEIRAAKLGNKHDRNVVAFWDAIEVK